jgi:hypothetical protein
VVVGLVEGGSVVIVTIVEAAALFERFSGEAGLKEQLAPASASRLHDSATELGMLVLGVRVSWVDPDCPGEIVRVEEVIPILKSGSITLTLIHANDCA